MYRIYRKISVSFQGDFEFLLKRGSFYKKFVQFYGSIPGVSLMMREVSHVCDRYLQNGCLCLQMDFDMAVFDDTRQILVANVVDRSEFYEDT